MGFYGITTAQTKSFLLVEKPCKEILLFFDVVILAKLTRCLGVQTYAAFSTSFKPESYSVQPSTF